MIVETIAVVVIAALAAWVGYRSGYAHGWRDCVDYNLKLDACTECGGSMRTPATHDVDCANRPAGLASSSLGISAGMAAYGPDHANYPFPPADWDGGRVKTRDGSVYLHEEYPGRWEHHGTGMDIVAYQQYSVEE